MKTKRLDYTLLLPILLSILFVGSFKTMFISFIIFLLMTYLIINCNNNRTSVLYSIIEIITLILLNSGRIVDIIGRLISLDYQQIIEQIKISKYSILMFALIQLLQVVVLPIPAQITTFSGVVVFGYFWTFVISSLMCILGSIINFILGRTFNKKLIHFLKLETTAKKYQNLFKDREILLLSFTFLLPIFPDDIICYIAGTTNISTKQFICVVIATRPISILTTCLFGSTTISLLSSHPIVTTAILLVASIIYISIKHFYTKHKKTKYSHL